MVHAQNNLWKQTDFENCVLLIAYEGHVYLSVLTQARKISIYPMPYIPRRMMLGQERTDDRMRSDRLIAATVYNWCQNNHNMIIAGC